MDWRAWDLNKHQLSPRKLRGNPGVGVGGKRETTDAPCGEVTEALQTTTYLVNPLGRVDLEVTSKGVGGNKVRKGVQQLGTM